MSIETRVIESRSQGDARLRLGGASEYKRVRGSAETSKGQVLTIGVLAACIYAVGTDASPSSNSPAIMHLCETLASSVPAMTILTV
jgi:hypothetical protein